MAPADPMALPDARKTGSAPTLPALLDASKRNPLPPRAYDEALPKDPKTKLKVACSIPREALNFATMRWYGDTLPRLLEGLRFNRKAVERLQSLMCGIPASPAHKATNAIPLLL